MSDVLSGAVLIAATLTMGLSAGLFCVFSYAIMPGLGRTDDRTFVEAMRQINVAILNPVFAVVFGGSMVLTIIAAVLHLGADRRSALPWIIAAIVLYGATLAITFGVNVPLNNTLAATGGPDPASRQRFEARWVRSNVTRAVTSTAAFGCLCWALVIFGRVTA